MTVIEDGPPERTDEEVAALLEPEVARWFRGQFATFTQAQRRAVPEVLDGRNVLISSPTGSGKTLSAFLAVLNDLVRLAKAGELGDRVHCVYVSPLKALNNDMERNVRAPIEGIRAVFEADGRPFPEIRVAVRTGDTPTSERQAQLRRPPHVLITTPESLALLLSAPRMGPLVGGARVVIVDEVHALAESKRGVHLALLLERLSAMAVESGRREPVRVGLSATMSPLPEVAAFLAGDRPCTIVDVSYLKQTDLRVVAPLADLVDSTPQEQQDALYALLDDLIASHRTTLVFTNTRAGTERVVHRLKERFGSKYAEIRDVDAEAADGAASAFVAAHHGSLSRETRLDVEERLRRGEIKCVVCSTSLELGLDIGYVDLVVLLGSPKGVARALQRVGRSGHRLHAVSKGRVIVLDRDDLVESVVLVKNALDRRLDAARLPRESLDVLCQVLVGFSLERTWGVDEALALVRRARPFRALERDDFVRCLRYLAGHYGELEERHVYGKIWLDEDRGQFGRRGRLARAIYAMNVGTIPDTTLAKVFHDDRYVGQVEEDFVESLAPGDVFVLGGATWQFLYARGMVVRVQPARGKRATVPLWRSEKLPLSADLARDVRSFRGEMARRLASDPPETTKAFLMNVYHVDDVTAEAVYGYFADQAAFALVPREDELLVEEFVDDDLSRTYAFHALYGRRTNEALARAFARALSRERDVNVRVQVSDNGFLLAVPRSTVLSATAIKALFHGEVRADLAKAVAGSELLKRRFRHVAGRALLVLRNYAGRSQTVGRRQVNAFVLLHVLRRMDPAFPVLKETDREVLEDALDAAGAEEIAFAVVTRRLRVVLLRQRKAPSPFAFNLVALGAEDSVLLDDRARLIRDLHERVRDLLAVGDAAR